MLATLGLKLSIPACCIPVVDLLLCHRLSFVLRSDDVQVCRVNACDTIPHGLCKDVPVNDSENPR
jgi:hypothetical protein